MKKLWILLILAGIASAGMNTTIVGKKGWVRPAYWHDTNSTSLLFMNDSIWKDSASSWIVTTGTVDTCSQPVDMTSGSSTEPFDFSAMMLKVRADSLDSATITYNVETRERKPNGDWTGWLGIGKTGSTGEFTILDTIGTFFNADTDWVWEKHLFRTDGKQLRVCPKHVANTMENDTIIHDSLLFKFK